MPAESPALINRCPFCNTWNPSLQFAQQLTEIPLVAQVQSVVVSCAVQVSTPEQWAKIAALLPGLKLKHPNWDRQGAAFMAMMAELAASSEVEKPRAEEIVQGLIRGVPPPKVPIICGAILGVHILEFINFAQTKVRH